MSSVAGPHEDERISALLDGTLTPAERTEVEAHLAGCADCREVADALRATAADLALLPAASFTQTDAWAIRSAVRRQSRGRLIGRLAPALAGVAAALVAVLAVTLGGSGGRSVGGGALQADQSAGLGGSVPFVVTDDNYTPEEVRERLLALAAPLEDAPALEGTGPGSTDGGGSTEGGEFSAHSAPAPAAKGVEGARSAEFEAAASCAGSLQSSAREPQTPVLYEAARFGGRPAFLIVFESATRWELWVVSRDSCATLFFTQEQR